GERKLARLDLREEYHPRKEAKHAVERWAVCLDRRGQVQSTCGAIEEEVSDAELGDTLNGAAKQWTRQQAEQCCGGWLRSMHTGLLCPTGTGPAYHELKAW